MLPKLHCNAKKVNCYICMTKSRKFIDLNWSAQSQVINEVSPASAYMPLEQSWFFPEKSPPIV